MEGAQDRCPGERPSGHPEERQRAHEPKSTGSSVAFEKVGGARGRDRDEDPAPQSLEEPRRDQLVERLGSPGERRTDREQGQRTQEEPARTEQVGQPAGQGHRDDVHEKVAVDDPRGAAQFGPVRGVVDDRRQRDRRDHQLEAREERPEPEDREQRNAGIPGHRPECTGGPGPMAPPTEASGRWRGSGPDRHRTRRFAHRKLPIGAHPPDRQARCA